MVILRSFAAAVAAREKRDEKWELVCYRELVDNGMVPELAAERATELRHKYQRKKIPPDVAARRQLRIEGWLIDSEIELE